MRIAALVLSLALPASAQVTQEKMSEIERKIEALSKEMENIKLGEAAPEPVAEKAQLSFGPAASKVYGVAEKKVSIGGYGEMSYQNFARRRQDGGSAGLRDRADFVRAILYAGYKFNDWILFNSETEFEHGSTTNQGARGEVSIEMAYLDFRFHELVGARAGLLLMPMGITNEMHEPTTFHGVQRPSVERNVIPSTWRENGAGLFGEWRQLSWRTYVVAGLQAVANTGPTGFTDTTGIRSGRSSGANSMAEDLAVVARADYKPAEGSIVGGSIYHGEADQGLLNASVPVSLWEVHGQTEFRGAELKALYTEGRISGTQAINASNGRVIGRRLFGGYAEGAFNVLSLCQTAKYLAPFFRYERYDTQLRTDANLAKNRASSRVEYTAGLTFKPIPQVAIKADHQWLKNQARTGVNQWNLGLGYIF